MQGGDECGGQKLEDQFGGRCSRKGDGDFDQDDGGRGSERW